MKEEITYQITFVRFENGKRLTKTAFIKANNLLNAVNRLETLPVDKGFERYVVDAVFATDIVIL